MFSRAICGGASEREHASESRKRRGSHLQQAHSSGEGLAAARLGENPASWGARPLVCPAVVVRLRLRRPLRVEHSAGADAKQGGVHLSARAGALEEERGDGIL